LAIYICKSGTCSYVTECDEEKFCMNCGQPLLNKCAKCHTNIKSKEQRFCHECGEGLKDESMPLEDIYNLNNYYGQFIS